jgi:hypothetical protein
LVGNSDTGTLYAVYDVLKQQGCRWIIPGETGEVVPQKESLGKINDKVEVPDYTTRGFFIWAQDFFPGAGWIYVNMDDYFDWALKNRMNAIWDGGQSYDFGAYRGHGWIQQTGHSFNASIAPYQEYFKTHPDWYPLVRGERMPVADVGPKLPNQLCVSNPGLREYTANLILDFFKNNPTSKAFPMNPMDGPNYWCECEECKKLDPPGIDWSKNGRENLPVADRLINYANYVADRIAKVYPDKLIEVYAYNPRVPPVKEKVHPNILIKFAFSSGRPINVSIMDTQNPMARVERQYLDGWKAAGVKHFAYYNYADWEHPDATLFWFFSITDVLKNLKAHYNFGGLLGETETQIQADPMWYGVMARMLWNVETDYRDAIRDICEAFYGPAATDMYEFNLLMDKTVRSGKANTTEQNRHLELSYDALVQGQALLDIAAAKVKADPVLTRRIALARFGFANLIYVRALYEERKTTEWAHLARDGFDTANAMRNQYTIMVKSPSVLLLKDFYYPVIMDEKSPPIVELPILWDFKTDPSNAGIKEEWFQKPVDSSWKKIRTDKAWTEQGYETYHGIAWYSVEFTLPSDYIKATPLLVYFGAVDGYADVFLDGRKIGEQKTDVGLMWDKPFTLPLPSDIDPAITHHLMVQVRKDSAAAGIWKPVKIMKILLQ